MKSAARATGTIQRVRSGLAAASFHPRRQGPHDIRARGVGAGEVTSALEGAWSEFVALLRDLDPADADRPVPHLKWTVGETAAHVVTTMRRGVDLRRAGTAEDLGALNDLCIEEFAERDIRVIADILDRELGNSRRGLRLLRVLWALRIGRWLTVELHAGITGDFLTMASHGVVDFLAHGYDIAAAVDRHWRIDPLHASTALRGCLPAAWPFIHEAVLNGPEQSVAVRLPDGHALEFRVGGGRFAMWPTKRSASNSTVDPVQLFLAICGRVAAGDPVVARIAGWYRPI